VWWLRVPLTVRERKVARISIALMAVVGIALVSVGLVKGVLPVTALGVLDLLIGAARLWAYLRASARTESN
jgi:hypothetical protein